MTADPTLLKIIKILEDAEERHTQKIQAYKTGVFGKTEKEINENLKEYNKIEEEITEIEEQELKRLFKELRK